MQNDPLTEALRRLEEKTGGKALDEGSVKFEFSDLGALRIDANGPRMDDGADADCTIEADIDTFKAMFDGELSPTSAFMSGRIRIDGDMGVAMKAASLLG